MTFLSYAQNFEDVMLWRALGAVENGFYIDLGAYHAEIDSVTRAFYDRGWRGINVEPVPEACQAIAAARPRDVTLNIAVGRAPGRTTFHAAQGFAGGLSTMEEASAARFGALGVTADAIDVEVQTLATVCDRHVPGDVHFLKIDVEGAERAVLEGADFSRWRPWIVLLEATAPMSTVEVHGEWEDLLLEADYRFIWFDGLNRYYAAAERFDAMAPHFRTPPNVFDEFIRMNDARWGRRTLDVVVESLQAQALLARRAELIGQQEAALEQLRSEVAGTRSQQADAQSRAEAAERGRAESEARVAAADAARGLAQDMVEAMRRSRSWRVTAPLRWLRGG